VSPPSPFGKVELSREGQYVIRFDSAGTELDLPPGATANIQGQSLVLPEGKEGGLTLDQRAMVRLYHLGELLLTSSRPSLQQSQVRLNLILSIPLIAFSRL